MQQFELPKRISALVVALIVAGACQDQSRAGAGTETNWLETCERDAQCGVGTCVCGVCSLACTTNADCSPEGALAVCATADSSAAKAVCGDSPTVAMCLPSCDAGQLCATGQQCVGSACVPLTSAASSSAGGESGSGGEASSPAPVDPSCKTAAPGEWVAMPVTAAPAAGNYERPLWTGSEMVVVNDIAGTASAYEPCANTWRALPSSGLERYAAPILIPRGLLYFETAPVALGWASRLTLLDLVQARWLSLTADSVPPNRQRAVFWTGKELVWWGGALQHEELTGSAHWEDRNDGGVYDLAQDQWRPISTVHAPVGRKIEGNAVWTGTQLVVWGGQSAVDPTANTELDYCFNGDYQQCQRFADGAVYDLATDTWTPITADGAPSRRQGHVMAWTGKDVLVVGGFDYPEVDRWTPLADAYRYSVSEDRWSTIALPQALHDAIVKSSGPDPRPFEWTGSRLLMKVATSPIYAYDPSADVWQTVSDPPNGAACPAANSQGVCVDAAGNRYYGLYDSAKNRWQLLDYPIRDQTLHSTGTIWTGSQLLEWGGYRVGPTPDRTACPPNVACDPLGPPSIYTNEGFVYTPAR